MTCITVPLVNHGIVSVLNNAIDSTTGVTGIAEFGIVNFRQKEGFSSQNLFLFNPAFQQVLLLLSIGNYAKASLIFPSPADNNVSFYSDITVTTNDTAITTVNYPLLLTGVETFDHSSDASDPSIKFDFDNVFTITSCVANITDPATGSFPKNIRPGLHAALILEFAIPVTTSAPVVPSMMASMITTRDHIQEILAASEQPD